MFDRASALAIDEAQKRQLESLARAGITPQKMARKCQVILLASQGVSNHAIAQQTGLSRPTILSTRAAFTERGIEGIRQAKTRKRSRRALTPEVEQMILDTTLESRPANATHWSVRVLASKLGVSRMMVQRVWQRYDIQPHRVEKFKISNDPKFEDKVRDVVGLYLDPPDRALVLCVDEKSQIQALEPDCSHSAAQTGIARTSERMTINDTERRRCLPPSTSSMARSSAAVCGGIVARSSSSFSINWRRKSRGP
jgi:Winged helix-turn helix